MPMLLFDTYSDPLVSVVEVLYTIIIPDPALLFDIAGLDRLDAGYWWRLYHGPNIEQHTNNCPETSD